MKEQQDEESEPAIILMASVVFLIAAFLILLGTYWIYIGNNYKTTLGIGFVLLFCNGVMCLAKRANLTSRNWHSIFTYIYGMSGVIIPITALIWTLQFSPQARKDKVIEKSLLDQKKNELVKEVTQKIEQEKKTGIKVCARPGCWNTATKKFILIRPGRKEGLIGYYCVNHDPN